MTRLLALVAFLFVLSTAFAQADPVLHFAFNGSTIDSSGNGAAISGSIRYAEDRFGNAEGAAIFYRNHFDDLIVREGSSELQLQPPFSYSV